MRNVDIVDLSSGVPRHIDPILSPTAVTHSIPRPTSTRSPDVRHVTPERVHGGFLAAERFPRSAPVIGDEASPTTARIRSVLNSPGGNSSSTRRHANGRESPEAWSLRSCSTPSRKDMQELMRRVKEVQSKAMAISTETKTETAPRIIKVPLKPGRETEAEREKRLQDEESKIPGVIETCIRDAAETGVACYRQECSRGDNRGDDRDFFTNSTQDEESTYDEVREKGSISSLSTMSQRKNPEKDLRSSRGAMRFPEAINVMDESKDLASPKRSSRKKRDRSSRRKRGEEEVRTEVSPTMEIVAAGEDPESMRQLRLQLFRKDGESVTVPKARLSRALGELVMQDDTIESIQTELEKTKTALHEAHKELERRNAASPLRGSSSRSTPTREKDVSKQSDAEAKLKKRKEQNLKLKAKISDLEIEANHLRSDLSRTKTDSDKHIKQLRDMLDEVQAKLEISQAKLRVKKTASIERPPDSPTVVSLRADVAALKAQLADARSDLRKAQATEISRGTTNESQLVSLKAKLIRTERELQEHKSKVAGMPELVRLKTRLQRVENELQTERDGRATQNVRSMSTGRAEAGPSAGGLSEILRLRTQLHRVGKERDQLESKSGLLEEAARDREEQLRTELSHARKALAEKEKSAESQIEHLITRVSTADREIAEGRKLSEMELTASRDETQRLKSEVGDLKKQLCETPKTAGPSGESTINTQEQLEQELRKSKETEKSLQSIITVLNARVDKAESDAKEAQKRAEQAMSTSQADVDEKKLREEIHALQNVLSNPTDETDTPVTHSATTVKKSSGSSIRNEVDQLKSRVLELIELEKRSLHTEVKSKEIASDDKKRTADKEDAIKNTMLVAQNRSLQSEVKILRSRLNESEAKFKQQRSKAKEELRQRNKIELDQLREINELKIQRMEYSLRPEANSSDSIGGQQWKKRHHDSEEQVSHLKARAETESRKRELTIKKIQRELSLSSRISSLRKRTSRRDNPDWDSSESISSPERSRSANNSNQSSPNRSRSSLMSRSSPFSSPDRSKSSNVAFSSPERSRASNLSFPSPDRSKSTVSNLSFQSPGRSLSGLD